MTTLTKNSLLRLVRLHRQMSDVSAVSELQAGSKQLPGRPLLVILGMSVLRWNDPYSFVQECFFCQTQYDVYR